MGTAAYVMLSRVVSFDRLAILRPFDEQVLRMKPPQNLLDELARLELYDKETEQRFTRKFGGSG